MVTYEQAVVDESLRQPYLDQFFVRHPSLFVDAVQYDPDGLSLARWVDEQFHAGKVSEHTLKDLRHCIFGEVVACVPKVDEWFGLSLYKLPIFVQPSLFEQYTEDGVRSVLAHHEYVHAEDFYKGVMLGEHRINWASLRTVDSRILGLFFEVRAYVPQLDDAARNPGIRRCGERSSEESYRRICVNVCAHRNLLLDIKPRNVLEEAIVEEMRLVQVKV
ncbi:MAG: hypothetical protein Q7R96_03305 [Nanoarchaeota archaeon]|nr:hypothetical protein [Nanoarchaeota archaeon]